MELYGKAIAAMLVTVILGVNVGKQEKELSILLTMAACCMGALAVVTFLQPVVELLRELESVADLSGGILEILLKCAGIALVAELAELICKDAGSDSLGKMVQMLASAVILYQSIPVFRSLLSIVQEILGGL